MCLQMQMHDCGRKVVLLVASCDCSCTCKATVKSNKQTATRLAQGDIITEHNPVYLSLSAHKPGSRLFKTEWRGFVIIYSVVNIHFGHFSCHVDLFVHAAHAFQVYPPTPLMLGLGSWIFNIQARITSWGGDQVTNEYHRRAMFRLFTWVQPKICTQFWLLQHVRVRHSTWVQVVGVRIAKMQ